jgi:predicted nucleic acid-binding protein
MVLVDTTVWVDFFTGKPTPQVTILELLISEGQDICVCGLVLTEVLQGVREERQYRKIKSYFENLPFLPMTQAMHLHSAEIYRSLRKRGITVRKPIDCMIASVAIAHKVQLLHNDRDFNHIEKHCSLKTVKSKKR